MNRSNHSFSLSQHQLAKKAISLIFALLFRLQASWEFLRRVNIVVSARGLLLLLFAIYLFSGPAMLEADIIATILSLALLAMTLTFALITIGYGLLLKKGFGITVTPPQDEYPPAALESGKAAAFLLRCTELQLPPLYNLSLKLEFENGRIETSLHRLKGAACGRRFIQERLVFPHRGVWQIRRIAARLQDQFGLTVFNWDLTAELSGQSVRVCPPRVEDAQLPILSSCRRSGDTLIDINNRQGEHFDLKQYHPSDGLRKIVWKIYAKAGKLISRHPEPSMTPEGQVVVYCLAAPQDDHVCSAALAYLRRLEDLELEMFVGCEGMPPERIARDPAGAEDLMIESIWKSAHSEAASLPAGLLSFITALQQSLKDSRVERVLIFCSPARLCKEEILDAYVGCGGLLEQNGIEPVFFAVPAKGVPARAAGISQSSRPLWGRLKPLLIDTPREAETAADLYPAFAAACMRSRWQVLS